ncbi:helix-turn-helix transcriptional regulator [Brevundimonas sp.]|uniref:helix-turn-helix domain-containing protein n=1 Tax=Brevundimonas sp. TaxID=1871086 RepID=UPI002D3B8255|nr:helix-turn-helix transcriptional regulator [Brevundimonas sp.]HYC74677.1 helix-turn-helix transcriptional regulator [Brevundimonas sp.]
MPRAIATTDPVDLVVGQRLKAARQRCGLSQAELGKAMNLSFQQVQKYERGTNRISASMLVRAGKALGVPVADFFPDVEPDPAADSRIDIRSLRGGEALTEHFAAMGPERRALLLQIAQAFALGPDDRSSG